jgi:hypothetical protein
MTFWRAFEILMDKAMENAGSRRRKQNVHCGQVKEYE